MGNFNLFVSFPYVSPSPRYTPPVTEHVSVNKKLDAFRLCPPPPVRYAQLAKLTKKRSKYGKCEQKQRKSVHCSQNLNLDNSL